MELYLDTSDVVAVKALSRIFPLAGVTTNPSIIAAGKKPLEVVLPELLFCSELLNPILNHMLF